MLRVLVLVVTLGIADSINPSTVAPALYIATAKDARGSVASFTVGVFAISLIGGLALALGPGQLLFSWIPHPSRESHHLIELALGVVALALSAVLWRGREGLSRRISKSEAQSERASFALGAGIMVLELPTAFPYFAAIAAVVDSGANVLAQIGLIVLFNVVFILPLLGIVALRSLSGEAAERRLAALRDWLHRRAGVLLSALVFGVGVALLTFGGLGLASG